jgi:large subunit ribosomal protein L33
MILLFSNGGVTMREKIQFKCTVCGDQNYIGKKNKKEHPEKMVIKKYCKRCNAVTEHKEFNKFK